MYRRRPAAGRTEPLHRAAILTAAGMATALVAGCQSQSVALDPNLLRSLSWSQTLAGSCAHDLPVAVAVVNAEGILVGSSIVGSGKSAPAPPAAASAHSGSATATAANSSAACIISTVVPVSRASPRYWVGVTLHTNVVIAPPNGGGGRGLVYGPYTSLTGVLTPPRGQ